MKTWEALQQLRDEGPKSPSFGICANIQRIDEQARKVYDRHCAVMYAEWPLWSGNVAYPVPHPIWSPSYGFGSSGSHMMWNEGKYARNRRELLAFAINWFKARDL